MKKSHPKKNKKPWPTKDAMDQVYKMNLWGNNDTDFYSGEGSHHPQIIEPYIKAVQYFIKSFESPPTVCDLGCGDFNIGKELFEFTCHYIAIDIAPDLIKHNKVLFKYPTLQFQCLDIAKDDLPNGDIAILRQVLQHLSNAEIQKIAYQLKKYQYLILTEHVPQGKFRANLDIISGQGTRLKKQSGVQLLEPPFNLVIKKETVLNSIELNQNKGMITTILYEI